MSTNRLLLTSTLWSIAITGMSAEYPSRAIRFIVPYATSGSPDITARILSVELSRQMGQQVIVDNRPGGNTTVGIELLVRSNPDGHTIGYASIGTLSINRALMAKQPYDPDRDLQLVNQLIIVNNLLTVTPSLPVDSVRGFIDYAKKNPGKLLMSTAENGTSSHIGGELFRRMAGIDVVHVPHRGSGASHIALMGGHVSFTIDNISSLSPHVRAGRLRGLAVSGLKRSPVFPDLPTIDEAGVPGFEVTAWSGVVVPKGVSRDIVTRINAEFNKALFSQGAKEKFALMGLEPAGGTPERFAAWVKRENVKWAEVIKRAGATAN